jgi:hypothetical protein
MRRSDSSAPSWPVPEVLYPEAERILAPLGAILQLATSELQTHAREQEVRAKSLGIELPRSAERTNPRGDLATKNQTPSTRATSSVESIGQQDAVATVGQLDGTRAHGARDQYRPATPDLRAAIGPRGSIVGTFHLSGTNIVCSATYQVEQPDGLLSPTQRTKDYDSLTRALCEVLVDAEKFRS